ncbi:DCTN1 family protein [Megaselia abdita]
MAEKNVKVGQKVEITGKKLFGKIAYVGMTNFAVGRWVGLILDEPKGKNNGTLKGQTYFTCPENYGMFVRPTQLTVIGGTGNMTGSSSEDIADAPKPSVTRAARLSGSRQSLSSSRQSLLGSRTQLSTSITSDSSSSANKAGRKSMLVQPSNRNSMGPPMNTTSSGAGDNSSGAHTQRSSFVETGFLEILTPQFTPSQPMRSPSFNTIEERTHSIEQQKLLDELKKQVADLTEKLETVKQRRLEDKERYRDFDKMKIQFEQLQEFKSKIMDAQASLQRELQRAKQEAKDAIEAKERHAEEMADLSDNIELITLDKEMAEEKADTLQLELESAKERIEELSVDLELLRAEISNKSEVGNASSSDVGVSLIYQNKQLEQQNHRLKETLLRLRDLSAHDKHDIQKINKELETKKSEVLELERTKEKFSTKIDELEATIGDLQEQVDAALGAEEMVEQLAETKMELEEKMKGLEEEIKELEQLEEIHEQLIESNHDLEMDLREELDMAHAAKKDMQRERDAAIETIYDRDQTVSKFRELVLKLNEQIATMREKSNVGNENQNSDQQIVTTESVDYNQMFAETKAYTRAIDVQLRKIELTQANERVQMLTSYMPDSFMSRGGDNDSILVVLLVSRIVFKVDIIVTQTRERFPAVDIINRETIFQGHSVQQYAFKSLLLHFIHNLQGVMHQILYGLNSCKPETLLRAGSSLPEMIAQEKSVDSIIELLKSNQLDENSSTDGIEKCVAFFNAMNSVLLAGEDDDLLNEVQLLRDSTAAINSSCEAILTDGNSSRCIIGGGNETSTDLILLIQYIIENTESIKQQVKLIKRRIPQDSSVVKCGMPKRTLENLRNVTGNLSKIMLSLHMAVKQALVVCSRDENEADIDNQGRYSITLQKHKRDNQICLNIFLKKTHCFLFSCVLEKFLFLARDVSSIRVAQPSHRYFWTIEEWLYRFVSSLLYLVLQTPLIQSASKIILITGRSKMLMLTPTFRIFI